MSGAVLLAFVASLAGAVVWYGVLTHSTSNRVAISCRLANGQGIDLLPNKGGSLLSTYLQGEADPELSPAQYQSYINGYYKRISRSSPRFLMPPIRSMTSRPPVLTLHRQSNRSRSQAACPLSICLSSNWPTCSPGLAH